MEERQGRILIAVILSLGIWMGMNYFLFPPQPTKKTNTITATTSTETSTSTETFVPKKEELKPIEEKKVVIDPKEIKKYFIETSSFLVELSSLGGRVEKYYIKNYPDLNGEDVLIVKNELKPIDFNGKQFKAIEITRNNGFDFNLSFEKDSISNSLFNQINFASSYNEKDKILSFETILPNKLIIKKEFIFYEKENYFKLNISIKNSSKEELTLANSDRSLYFKPFSSLGPLKDDGQILEKDKVHFFRFWYFDSFSDNIEGTSTEGFISKMFGSSSNKDQRFETILDNKNGVDFAGSGSRYFIAVMDPLNHKPDGILLDNRKDNVTGIVTVYNDIKLKPDEIKVLDFANYIGIREADGMSFRDSNLDPSKTKSTPFQGLSDKLDKSFNQGLTTPFRNLIVWVLKGLYKVIPNYGWDIVLFAIFFKLIFYPLNQKQAESMKKMQELKPQIDEINIKYEKDAMLRQQKIMDLYKKNKTNPMSGCLPMVIQIPIFVALYTAFSDVVDLWKTPFLWIPDLSEPDTIWTTPALLGMSGIALNVLPLIMVVTQVFQTKMTAVSTDPNQKMMIYMMPVLMLYFFWSMPSGVTLYWTLQNILSIVQQVLTNKYSKNTPAVVVTTTHVGKKSR